VLFVDQVLPRLEQAVFLRGNVNRPGRYQFHPGLTVRDLVPSLEALKPESFFEYGHIRRPAPDDDRPTILSFSLREVLDGTARVALEPRDEVIIYNRYEVVERPSVRVSGVVRRSGEFLYREGMTVTDLVILAGGVRDIYLPEAHLRRLAYDAERDTTFTELVRVNLKAALENPKGDANLVLKPFDALTIFPRTVFEPTGRVSVRGTVRNPGRFPLSQGMRVSDLVVLARGLPDEAHVLEAHLNRRVHDAERDTFFVELARVNLRRILESPGGEHDLELRPHDELRVFHRDVFEPRRHVSIGGAVRNPGRFSMVEQMRVTDLIKLGGGLDDAHILEAHLFREVPVPERDSVFRQLVRINLRQPSVTDVGP
jgi:polysaccharide biosynthesis/export protein